MENKIQEELRAILNRYERHIECDEYHIHSDDPEFKNEKSAYPLSEHEDFDEAQAIASLTSLINREVVRELEDIPPIPTFLYTTRHDPKKLKESMGRANAACVHIYNRIKTLTPGGSDND